MKKITRINAIIIGIEENRYVLRDINTNKLFHIDVVTMHEKVIFPADTIDDEGHIKSQKQVSIVMKQTNSGKIIFLPDTSHYPPKRSIPNQSIKFSEIGNIEKIAAEAILDIVRVALKKNI